MKEVKSRPLRILLVILGYISVGLGVLGAFLPLLPTTPFILLAFCLFYRSSPRAKDWLLSHRMFGGIVRNYFEHRGIPLHAKIFAYTSVWLTISYTALCVIKPLWLKVLLFAIAIGVTIHISRFKTIRKSQEKNKDS